jgi:hypothetical protein
MGNAAKQASEKVAISMEGRAPTAPAPAQAQAQTAAIPQSIADSSKHHISPPKPIREHSIDPDMLKEISKWSLQKKPSAAASSSQVSCSASASLTYHIALLCSSSTLYPHDLSFSFHLFWSRICLKPSMSRKLPCIFVIANTNNIKRSSRRESPSLDDSQDQNYPSSWRNTGTRCSLALGSD